MFSPKYTSHSSRVEAPYLQPPPGKRFVRSFLFSRRVDAPLAQVHLLARIIFVLSLSSAQLRAINTDHPDLVSAIFLWILSIALFAFSGMPRSVARWYVLLTIPTLISLFLTWTLFNPVPSRLTFWQQPLYAGYLTLALGWWELLWLALVAGYYLWRRSLLTGILLASLLTIGLSQLFALPEVTLAHFPFFHPLTLWITDRGILLAATKMIGYSGMILSTLALVVTSRDIELIGVLIQLRIPQPIIFFLSTVFRTLNLAIADYETIYQAQIARAINARPRSFIRRLRDFGSITVPMVAMMIRRSSEIGDALLARGYTLRQAMPDFYETSPWRGLDWLVLVISLALFYLALAPHPVLTTFFIRGI